MGLVRIHCYGCEQTVAVEQAAMSAGLEHAGWSLAGGETFCPACAGSRGLSPLQGESAQAAIAGGENALPVTGSPAPRAVADGEALAPFPASPALAERRSSRAPRLLRASLSVLREDPQLMIFPVVSLALTLLLSALPVAYSIAHTSSAGAAAGAGRHDVLFIASLLVAYPITFVSLYCGVALAAVLAGRLEGRPMSAGDGWMAARERIGLIAGWTLLACTVGVLLRVVERYVPLGARILVAIIGLSWALATMFAVPVLAYENLGPRATLTRSRQIFTQRWGTQLTGIVGIGVASLLLYLPLIVLVAVGLAVGGTLGAALVTVAGIGLLGAIAVQMALDQIFRVFVYRNAVGLDTSSGPFTQSDLQAPFARRGRRGR